MKPSSSMGHVESKKIISSEKDNEKYRSIEATLKSNKALLLNNYEEDDWIKKWN